MDLKDTPSLRSIYKCFCCKRTKSHLRRQPQQAALGCHGQPLVSLLLALPAELQMDQSQAAPGFDILWSKPLRSHSSKQPLDSVCQELMFKVRKYINASKCLNPMDLQLFFFQYRSSSSVSLFKTIVTPCTYQFHQLHILMVLAWSIPEARQHGPARSNASAYMARLGW